MMNGNKPSAPAGLLSLLSKLPTVGGGQPGQPGQKPDIGPPRAVPGAKLAQTPSMQQQQPSRAPLPPQQPTSTFVPKPQQPIQQPQQPTRFNPSAPPLQQPQQPPPPPPQPRHSSVPHLQQQQQQPPPPRPPAVQVQQQPQSPRPPIPPQQSSKPFQQHQQQQRQQQWNPPQGQQQHQQQRPPSAPVLPPATPRKDVEMVPKVEIANGYDEEEMLLSQDMEALEKSDFFKNRISAPAPLPAPKPSPPIQKPMGPPPPTTPNSSSMPPPAPRQTPPKTPQTPQTPKAVVSPGVNANMEAELAAMKKRIAELEQERKSLQSMAAKAEHDKVEIHNKMQSMTLATSSQRFSGGNNSSQSNGNPSKLHEDLQKSIEKLKTQLQFAEKKVSSKEEELAERERESKETLLKIEQLKLELEMYKKPQPNSGAKRPNSQAYPAPSPVLSQPDGSRNTNTIKRAKPSSSSNSSQPRDASSASPSGPTKMSLTAALTASIPEQGKALMRSCSDQLFVLFARSPSSSASSPPFPIPSPLCSLFYTQFTQIMSGDTSPSVLMPILSTYLHHLAPSFTSSSSPQRIHHEEFCFSLISHTCSIIDSLLDISPQFRQSLHTPLIPAIVDASCFSSAPKVDAASSSSSSSSSSSDQRMADSISSVPKRRVSGLQRTSAVQDAQHLMSLMPNIEINDTRQQHKRLELKPLSHYFPLSPPAVQLLEPLCLHRDAANSPLQSLEAVVSSSQSSASSASSSSSSSIPSSFASLTPSAIISKTASLHLTTTLCSLVSHLIHWSKTCRKSSLFSSSSTSSSLSECLLICLRLLTRIAFDAKLHPPFISSSSSSAAENELNFSALLQIASTLCDTDGPLATLLVEPEISLSLKETTINVLEAIFTSGSDPQHMQVLQQCFCRTNSIADTLSIILTLPLKEPMTASAQRKLKHRLVTHLKSLCISWPDASAVFLRHVPGRFEELEPDRLYQLRKLFIQRLILCMQRELDTAAELLPGKGLFPPPDSDGYHMDVEIYRGLELARDCARLLKLVARKVEIRQLVAEMCLDLLSTVHRLSVIGLLENETLELANFCIDGSDK